MCHTKSLISKIYPNVHSNTHTPETKYKAILEIEKGVMKWVCDANALNIELTNTKIKKKAENFAKKFNEKKL